MFVHTFLEPFKRKAEAPHVCLHFFDQSHDTTCCQQSHRCNMKVFGLRSSVFGLFTQSRKPMLED